MPISLASTVTILTANKRSHPENAQSAMTRSISLMANVPPRPHQWPPPVSIVTHHTVRQKRPATPAPLVTRVHWLWERRRSALTLPLRTDTNVAPVVTTATIYALRRPYRATVATPITPPWGPLVS